MNGGEFLVTQSLTGATLAAKSIPQMQNLGRPTRSVRYRQFLPSVNLVCTHCQHKTAELLIELIVNILRRVAFVVESSSDGEQPCPGLAS